MPEAMVQQGRPRDPGKDESILDSAAALFLARGYADTTVDQIAEAAGTGKQTLYRRWPSKGLLAIAVLRRQADAEIPTDRGLERFLLATAQALKKSGGVLRALMAAAQQDSALQAHLKRQLIEPRRHELAKVLKNLPQSQQQWAIAAVFGAVWYRLLLDEPLSPAFCKGITRLITEKH